MNKHIKSYLKEFITMDKPQYAVMLKGDWGSGKTHFIKNFIENDKNNKYVYVSLFGLKSTEAIDEAIFDELHPVLSSAPVKVLNTVFKSALKLGLKVDVDSENTKLNSVNANINLDGVLDYFSKKNSKKNIIFVFDDLERTLLDYTEVLGYINSMVETSGLTVIIIANEDKITDSVFSDFKEKTINKTYKLVANNNEVFSEIVNRYSILNNHVEGIRNIFDKSGNNNFRVLTQVIDNYKYFVKYIPPRFKKIQFLWRI
ncbi:P-loop NTPase fold protein [Psychrobacter fjordensis]|uniref:P-loop NTPase fold protein n=1 Tax=Psychrobacter fjordensis TaxID=664424 RepID=UPI001D126605|nr:P-loop NTPase fold protein [Psychrobacter fjordensis]